MKKEKTIDLSEKNKEKENEKEEYAKPNVEEYGTLQELTQSGGSHPTDGQRTKAPKRGTSANFLPPPIRK
ncbi:MAG TPA: hypothetical protein ENI07_10985 [Desulfobacterales bacterium]|nr:hypothetical protein [Desulfobacterales bacterium]